MIARIATEEDLTDNPIKMSKNVSRRNEEKLRQYLAAQQAQKPVTGNKKNENKRDEKKSK